ncbi:MAG: cell wall-binding repeat-containing protein [Actinobacteria bacterium]|nr:cell wall-binding repeat-containing protein [Actinomycetota bacterium]MBU1609381.1 cell wall-binding repeat-containing protein [Actinomycetota bacterium]MBU2315013.1 cell wall-binding repeat-containing protein [Actinomycetota bacterium]MBU2385392.1 cell wall-binding repeat-containing protein [Actinomycetota bacterium]
MPSSLLARVLAPVAVAALLVPLGALPAQARAIEPAPPAGFTPAADPGAGGRVPSPTPGLTAAAAGEVTGRILISAAGGGSTQPATTGNTLVRFWREDSGQYFLEDTVSSFDGDGDFSVLGLPAGGYRLEVLTLDTDGPGKEYWNDQEFWFEADTATLSEDITYAFPTITVAPIELAGGRISGDDRYATSVAISQALTGTGGAEVVYLVNGLGYADALSAGPAAAANGGVLLLTRPDAVPSIVRSELRRLDPGRVVIVGGTAAIRSSVVSTVRSLLPDAEVDRIAGVDRYDTSRAIVADAWPGTIESVAVATGRNFPDALSAGAAISSVGGAVVLVDGQRSSLDVATRTFLGGIAPQYVAIAGGTSSVSSGIASSLNALPSTPDVDRFGGADRYETALIMNQAFFRDSAPDYAFLATGAGFADALAGGPLAAALGAPIYLSTQRCLSLDTYREISGMYVREIYALGGAAVLSDRVLYGSLC